MKQKKFIKGTAKLTEFNIIDEGLVHNKSFASTFGCQKSELTKKHHLVSKDFIPVYDNVTSIVKLNGKDVKIHALCTGTVAVKTNFRTKKGLGELSKLNILLDQHYTQYLPIWVWVIEHPEGLIVIDTGENTAIKNIDYYLSKESWFLRYQFKHAAKFEIDKKDELNYQFEKIKLKLDDVQLVVLTHLHLDHTDGLKFFSKPEIIVGNTEYNYPTNNMPSTYPSWFRPNKVNYNDNRIHIFNQAYAITSSDDLLYIPTPGHTHGHSSIVFKTDEYDIFFAGDTSYNQRQILTSEHAGVTLDFKKSKQTYENIITYSRSHKTIYLPTHDENAGLRLKNKEFLS